MTRLHLFDCGTLRTQLQRIKLDRASREPYEIPVPWYLVEHPRGNVLIDGGNAPQCATDADAHWGPIAERFRPMMTPEQACVPQLRARGIDPASIAWILQSHLHMDHTGALAALAAFPQARVLVDPDELAYARAVVSDSYIRADFDRPGMPWVELPADGHDLHGDGAIRVWRTPGHTPGHCSFELALPRSGAILLPVDAAYTRDHWDGRARGFATSPSDAARSLRKLHRIAETSRATVILGHDPDEWPALERAWP